MKNIFFLWGLIFGFFMLAGNFGFAEEQAKVRFSPLSGSWYPAEPNELRKMLKDYLDQARVPMTSDTIVALISPHAGYVFSGKAAAYGFKTLEGKDFDRVIIIGPSHHAWFRGVCVSSFDYYETPLGKVPVDTRVGEELAHQKLFLSNRDAEAAEHSLEMEIPFLQMVLKKFSIVPLLVGEMGEEDYLPVTRVLKHYVTDKTLVVVSSDFTHFGDRFGYQPFTENIKENLKKLDQGAVDLIVKKDFNGYQTYIQQTGATICGRNAIGILLQVLPAEAHGTLLNYYTSGDLTHDYGSTVSYVSVAFQKPEKKRE